MREKTNEKGITKVGKGKYAIRVTVTSRRTGKRRNLKDTIEGTLTEAVSRREELRREGHEDVLVRRMIVTDYAQLWLRRKAGEIKPSTLDAYRSHVEAFCERFGDAWVDTLRPGEIVDWLNELKSSYALSTLMTRVGILRGMARHAIRKEFIASVDFMDDIKISTRGSCRKANYLEAQHVIPFLEWFRENEPQWYEHVYVLTWTGIRWGEMTALLWSDIDWHKNEIHVTKAQVNGKLMARPGEKPSTKSGSPRDVPMSPPVADLLKARWQRMFRNQEPLQNGLVFPVMPRTPRQGEMYKQSALGRPIARACKALGIRRITAHGLRHTYVTHLAPLVSQVELERLVGHSSVAMSARYTHLSTERKLQAQAALMASLQAAAKQKQD